MSLPETMKRSMSRQAEADRERRARVITADGELQASKKLAAGGRRDVATTGGPAAAVAADGGRGGGGEELTLVLPFPVELLRFLERAQQQMPDQQRTEQLSEPE